MTFFWQVLIISNSRIDPFIDPLTDLFTEQVESSLQQLQSELTSLKDEASVRRLRLLDAVESQMFYTEAVEAETWIREKRQILTSSDAGKDEDAIIVITILYSLELTYFSSITTYLN